MNVLIVGPSYRLFFLGESVAAGHSEVGSAIAGL